MSKSNQTISEPLSMDVINNYLQLSEQLKHYAHWWMYKNGALKVQKETGVVITRLHADKEKRNVNGFGQSQLKLSFVYIDIYYDKSTVKPKWQEVVHIHDAGDMTKLEWECFNAFNFYFGYANWNAEKPPTEPVLTDILDTHVQINDLTKRALLQKVEELRGLIVEG